MATDPDTEHWDDDEAPTDNRVNWGNLLFFGIIIGGLFIAAVYVLLSSKAGQPAFWGGQ